MGNITNFPNGVSSFGITLFGGGGGIPTTFGTVYFVDPTNGSNGNDGMSPDAAFATVEFALTQCVSGNDDVICLRGNATHNLAAMLSVTISRVHFVGLDGAWRMYGQGAKVQYASSTGTAANIAAMLNTGVRNSFTNIKFISNATITESIYGVVEAGEYGTYTNCEFYKGTDLDQTGAADLVNNGDSSQFYNCTIGSLADAVAGSSIIRPRMLIQKDIGGTGKVLRDGLMVNCQFWTQAVNTTNVLININGATDVERILTLRGCGFHANKAGAAVPAVAIRLGATLTVGQVVLDPNCFGSNVTKIATGTGVIVSGSAVSSAAGIGVNAA